MKKLSSFEIFLLLCLFNIGEFSSKQKKKDFYWTVAKEIEKELNSYSGKLHYPLVVQDFVKRIWDFNFATKQVNLDNELSLFASSLYCLISRKCVSLWRKLL